MFTCQVMSGYTRFSGSVGEEPYFSQSFTGVSWVCILSWMSRQKSCCWWSLGSKFQRLSLWKSHGPSITGNCKMVTAVSHGLEALQTVFLHFLRCSSEKLQELRRFCGKTVGVDGLPTQLLAWATAPVSFFPVAVTVFECFTLYSCFQSSWQY